MSKAPFAISPPGLALGALALLVAGAPVAGRSQQSPDLALVFLTRDDCVNTGTMRMRLDEALDRLGSAKDYRVIDADTLPDSDPRGGYGTPTVLYANRDLFGMPEPSVPHPAPT